MLLQKGHLEASQRQLWLTAQGQRTSSGNFTLDGLTRPLFGRRLDMSHNIGCLYGQDGNCPWITLPSVTEQLNTLLRNFDAASDDGIARKSSPYTF